MREAGRGAPVSDPTLSDQFVPLTAPTHLGPRCAVRDTDTHRAFLPRCLFGAPATWCTQYRKVFGHTERPAYCQKTCLGEGLLSGEPARAESRPLVLTLPNAGHPRSCEMICHGQPGLKPKLFSLCLRFPVCRFHRARNTVGVARSVLPMSIVAALPERWTDHRATRRAQ